MEEGGYGLAGWFLPRIYTQSIAPYDHANLGNDSVLGLLASITNSTVVALASATLEEAKQRITKSSAGLDRVMPYGAGIGVQWLRRLLERNEWTLPCIGVKIRL